MVILLRLKNIYQVEDKMNLLILGCLWGDEAKAKVVQHYLEHHDVVVRFQGGANAGHTVYLEDGSKLVLHSIPVGIICEDKTVVIAAGCLVNPETLIEEIKELESRGINVMSRLKIYSNTTITTDFEVALDRARETFLSSGSSKIGTTGRGIGPSYSNRAFRTAILFEDLLDQFILAEKVRSLSIDMNPRIRSYGAKEVDPESVFQKLHDCSKILSGLMVHPNYVYSLIESKKNILFEGAQGGLLCLTNGSYPYVTSSSVHPASASIGSNIPMKSINKVIGVLKAYPTRVGEGPFPTQISAVNEEILRKIGKEYGATTGRPRKCGWPDLPIASYVGRLFGIDEFALTCLDTLCEFSAKTGPIKICDFYEISGRKIICSESASASYLSKVKPVYSEFDLGCNCSGVNNTRDLPLKAANFVNLIQNKTGIPVKLISTGPLRENVIVL